MWWDFLDDYSFVICQYFLHIWLNGINIDECSLVISAWRSNAIFVDLFDVYVTMDLAEMEQVANIFIWLYILLSIVYPVNSIDVDERI